MCPYSLKDLGNFRMGPSAVDFYDSDSEHTGSFFDATRGYFTVKQDSRIRFSSATKSKKIITFKTRHRYYSLSASAWSNMRSRNVYLQRLSGKKWKNVKKVRANKYGMATIGVKVSKKYTWRLSTGATSATWNATSKSLRK